MGELLVLDQDPLQQVGDLPWIREADVLNEPTVRSASVATAYEHGGPITREFLDIAEAAGLIAANSIVMSQRTPFVSGAYSTPPHWHGDFTQGRGPRRQPFADAIRDNTGVIAVLFETSKHPDDKGTIFIQGGPVTLDLARQDGREYKGREAFLGAETGELEWQHEQIEAQLAAPDTPLRTFPLQPNTLYTFGSHNIHRVPQMLSDGGARLVMRVNTPVDPSARPAIKDNVFPPGAEPQYVVRMIDDTHWVRESLPR
jgi:hypothetical protein